jgi:hypothetical protein
MSGGEPGLVLEALRARAGDAPAPPPSARLRKAVAAMQPVRTRRPWRALVAVTAAALVFPGWSLAVAGLRADVAGLSPAWLGLVGLVWAAAFAVALASALIPPRGAVLPHPARAGLAAAAAAAAAVAAALVPGQTAGPPAIATTSAVSAAAGSFLDLWWHCARFGLEVAAPLVVAGGFALRRVLQVGARRVGAALGAAGGALGGLCLHFGCPYGDVSHVVAAHAGALLLAAAAGAVLLPFVLRRAPPDVAA